MWNSPRCTIHSIMMLHSLLWQAERPSQSIYCLQVAAIPVSSWASYCLKSLSDFTRFSFAFASWVWIPLFANMKSGQCCLLHEGQGEQEAILTDRTGVSVEPEWVESGQKLHGRMGFGHAKLLSYFQSIRMHTNWKHRLGAESSLWIRSSHPYNSINEFFRYKAGFSDTRLQ